MIEWKWFKINITRNWMKQSNILLLKLILYSYLQASLEIFSLGKSGWSENVRSLESERFKEQKGWIRRSNRDESHPRPSTFRLDHRTAAVHFYPVGPSTFNSSLDGVASVIAVIFKWFIRSLRSHRYRTISSRRRKHSLFPICQPNGLFWQYFGISWCSPIRSIFSQESFPTLYRLGRWLAERATCCEHHFENPTQIQFMFWNNHQRSCKSF